MSRGITRRQTLKGTAATALAACGPGGGDTGAPGDAIDTVIYVMLENRSFDHWLGARSLLEGREDEDGLAEGMSNPSPDGEDQPPFATTEPCLADPPHSWSSSHTQFNDGANDGFCREYAARIGGDGAGVMAYQTRQTTPVSWALADDFTVCNRSFCSVLGPTWPNRLYAHLGTSEGKTDNSLSEDGLFASPSIWGKLIEAGVDWAYYYSDLPFISLIEDSDPNRIHFIDDFFTDCANGRLPPVVQIEPAFSYNDNHPPHHPMAGELFLATIVEAIATSPHWNRCLILVTYDEHGGFFDHVPPPTIDDERASDGFDQMGFRIPTLAVGPWVHQGVDPTVYDHTSWLKLLCDLHGITPWNTRIEAANSFMATLDSARISTGVPRQAPVLPAVDFDDQSIDPLCLYGPPPPYLQILSEKARQRGLPLRPVREVSRPFLRYAKKRGLLT